MPQIRRLFLLLVLLATPALLHAQREKLPPDDLDFVEKTWPDAKKTSTGIRYIEETNGSGNQILPGQKVQVIYTGKLLHGKVFDRTKDRTKPFEFRVGRSEVIQGWDQILQLMRPGDKWLVIIPPELAYGRRGEAPAIPGDATLLFEIEVLGIKADT